MGERPTLVPEPFAGQAELNGGGSGGRVEWAVTWPADRDDGFTSSYCNTVPTPDGGTHEAGLRAAGADAVVGRIDEVREQTYAITTERRLTHPVIVAIYQRARVLNGLRHNKPRAWELRAQRIDVDTEDGMGTARHATLRIGRIPVLYLPWFRFPPRR